MTDYATAIDGDTVDLIALRERGETRGVTEAILDLNPGLAELGPILPLGTRVALPEPVKKRAVRDVPRIWS